MDPWRYQSADEDSGRWAEFAFRPDDIVISTRSKHGTTWMQMICALLVFQTPELPAPLAALSPWLDWLVTPLDEVLAALAAQSHRRFIKTHTPLDGLSLPAGVTAVVVARHPLDAAVSLYHQADNLDRGRMRALAGATGTDPPPRPPLAGWLRTWIAATSDPRLRLDSLPGVMAHIGQAWQQRDDPGVVLVRYADLCADLGVGMRALAERLGIDVDPQRWPALERAATFDAMRANAAALAPDPAGVLKDAGAFFRLGSSGAGRDALTAEDLARYHQRAAELAPPDLLAWLHGSG